MTDSPPPSTPRPKPPTGADLRKKRQAEALRANLARRKQQERERADGGQDGATEPEPDLAPDPAKR